MNKDDMRRLVMLIDLYGIQKVLRQSAEYCGGMVEPSLLECARQVDAIHGIATPVEPGDKPEWHTR